MNLIKLYEKQRYLEQFVRKNIGMTEEDFSSVPNVDKRVFALKVEVAEFANEVSWFKYWKQSHVMNREHALEELADCVHFFLAIGLYRNYHSFVHDLDYKQWLNLPDQHLWGSIMENGIGSSGRWKSAFEQLIAIGIKLGFSEDEILLAYYLKNQKNIERQMNNY
jgi:dimeric dUTPase (all-alpha-NTP-PPase superfamily)